MNDANRTASDIVRFVGIERGEMALLRAEELLNETSYFISRWDTKLPEKSKTNLLRVREQLISIHDVLIKKPILELTPSQKVRLAQSCQQVNVILSEELGTATKATDKAD